MTADGSSSDGQDGKLALDDARRRRLARTRGTATGLLAASGSLYVATHAIAEPGFWTMLVRSGAEAGVVGGLADWFAVTALFRHPLGLPIPHTAIIPNNKERIGQALSRFVEQNFLTREVLLSKLQQAELGRRLAAWLAAPNTAPILAEQIVALVPRLIRTVESPELRDFFEKAVGEQLRKAEAAPALGRVLQVLTASGEADALFERLLETGARWLESNSEHFQQLAAERSRWWLPKTINRQIAKRIVDGVMDVLNGLRGDSDQRRGFREALAQVADELIHSAERRQQINILSDRILSQPEVQAWITSIWNGVSQSALRDLQTPSSATRAAFEYAIRSAGQTLASDQSMLASLDRMIERLALMLVLRRREIAGVITEVIRTWDARTLSDRLEFAVGSDLQYIRINGTLVGAGVGCLIFLLARLFGAA